jgi:phosphoglycolate phosphatase
MPYAAILLDLDGTLVDTITLYEKAVLQSLQELDISATHEEFFDWYVRPLHLAQILALHGLSEDQVPALRIRRDEIYIEFLAKESEWLPGAREVLDYITENKIPSAIVTGSWMTYVDAIDRHLHLREYVEEFVTAEEIHRFMKPHPHGLLVACDRLGVDPKDCIYIGDQQSDVEAANAAGMDSALIKGPWTAHNAGKGTSKLLTSMHDLMPYINR